MCGRLIFAGGVLALVAITLTSAPVEAQLGGAKGAGDEIDNCSGYSTEQLLNFLAGVISGSTETPKQLLTDSQPTNCNVNFGQAPAKNAPAKNAPAKNGPGKNGRRLQAAPNDRKLLQLNKICAGLQCLEGAITAKLNGVKTADQVTATIVAYCSDNIDGTGTATVGKVYEAAVKLFPLLDTLSYTIANDLKPYCS